MSVVLLLVAVGSGVALAFGAAARGSRGVAVVVVHEAWVDTGPRRWSKPRWVAADAGLAVPIVEPSSAAGTCPACSPGSGRSSRGS